MRKGDIFEGGIYHVYNRGFEKRQIFFDYEDHLRFIANILIFQGPVSVVPFSRAVEEIIKPLFQGEIAQPRRFCKRLLERLEAERFVEVIAFILMPNHFHIIVRELKEGGIAKFMARLGNAYTKYFNIRYKRKGYLFEGSYNAVLIDTDKYLLYVSAYVHKNSTEIKEWKGREWLYPWSSFSDFVTKNRWGKLLMVDEILTQFENREDYKQFVQELPIKEATKEGSEEIEILHNLRGYAK